MDYRIHCLLLVLHAKRQAQHPRLPPELLELVHCAFCDPTGSLERLCAQGGLSALQHWHDAHGISGDLDQGVVWASEHNQRRTVQWLCHTFAVSPQGGARALKAACLGGHADLARWLSQTFPTAEPDGDAYYVLLYACQKGFVRVAQWLHQRFAVAITPTIVKSALNAARAWDDDRLDMLAWLHGMGALAAVDMRDHVRNACQFGNLAAVQWMCGMTRIASVDACEALAHACNGGHLATARWMQDEFQCALSPARARQLFMLACMRGALDVAQWLVATFHITQTQVRANQNEILYSACRCHNAHVVKWLCHTFGLAPVDALPFVKFIQACCQ